eukprot:5138039-Lingulodinium_polyedra.AAC.1
MKRKTSHCSDPKRSNPETPKAIRKDSVESELAGFAAEAGAGGNSTGNPAVEASPPAKATCSGST